MRSIGSLPPQIATERLRLVTLTRGLAQARLEGLSQHGDVRFTPEWPGDALPLLLALVSSSSETLNGTYAILLGDEAIGMAGTKGRALGGRAVEIGYGLVPQARGTGLATEATAALTEALHRCGLVVTALTERGNRASERVLEKCGFVRGGEHPQRDGPPVTDWTSAPRAGTPGRDVVLTRP